MLGSFPEQARAVGTGVAPPRRSAIDLSMAVAVTLVTGCYHLVMPVNPPRLSDEVAPLQVEPRRTVRLINGYTEMQTVWFRTEGIHHVGADLREWTDRLLSQLQIELEPRGVSSLIERGDSPPGASGAALRIRITSIVPPDVSSRTNRPDDALNGGGALLEATIESEDGDYKAEFSSGAISRGFSDAFYNLKESILLDGNLGHWFRRSSSDS